MAQAAYPQHAIYIGFVYSMVAQYRAAQESRPTRHAKASIFLMHRPAKRFYTAIDRASKPGEHHRDRT